MPKMSGLPGLRFGQVWQCRDQSLVTITLSQITDYGMLGGRIHGSPWFFSPERGGPGFYQGSGQRGLDPSKHDLVHLVYDPEDNYDS